MVRGERLDIMEQRSNCPTATSRNPKTALWFYVGKEGEGKLALENEEDPLVRVTEFSSIA